MTAPVGLTKGIETPGFSNHPDEVPPQAANAAIPIRLNARMEAR